MLQSAVTRPVILISFLFPQSLDTPLVVSLLQAVTQINEATLVFLPKLVLVGGLLALLGPFMMSSLTDYSHALMDQVVAVGGR